MVWDENGLPTTTREKRWLELYSKHDDAWRQWMVETYADRSGSLTFINKDRVTLKYIAPDDRGFGPDIP